MLCVVEHGPSENVGLASFSFACDTGGPRVRPPFGKAINYIYIHMFFIISSIFIVIIIIIIIYTYIYICVCM